jgi:hypothetical protein
MVTPPGGWQPQTQDLGSNIEDIVRDLRPHRTNGEIQKLEELLTEYEYIFAGRDEYYGRTNKIYHCIDTGDPGPLRQHPRRIPMATQAEEKYNDMGLLKNQRHLGRSPSFLSGTGMGKSVSVCTTGN